MTVQFKVIYADPPWSYSNKATRACADNHYKTMELEDIKALPVNKLGLSDSALFLWTTSPFLKTGFEVLEAWGYNYKSALVWCKPQMGLGNYFRISTEFVLLGIKGRMETTLHNVKSYFVEDRTKHSKKPDEVRQIIEKMFPGPRIELFARERYPLWHAWGDEVNSDVLLLSGEWVMKT